jgi:hypothetical protein
MSNADSRSDPIARACELVGRFAYHFSRLDEQLNAAIVQLFNLGETTADIITSNIDFARKLNIVKSAVNEQNASPEQEWLRNSIKETFSELHAVNTERQVVAHSAFVPHEKDGVQFRRTVARGQLNRLDPHWTEEKFEREFQKMKKLELKLESVLRHIKSYTPNLDFSDPRNSMYLGIFGI